MVLTIDNDSNLTYPPYLVIRLAMKLGVTPYHVGRTMSRAKIRSVLESAGMRVERETAIFHYPHPDGIVRLSEKCLRQLSGRRLDGFISNSLKRLDGLETKRTRFLTGRYLALKAIKL